MANQVNYNMIVLARDATGLSQKDLATKSGLPQSRLSKYENGLLLVSDFDLNAISAVTGYHREFFYSNEAVFGLGSALLFNRKKKTAPIGVQRKVQAKVNIARIQISRLLNAVEIEAANQFELIDVDAEDDVADIARRIRSAWRIPLGPIQSVTHAIESAGGIVVLCEFGTRDINAAHLWVGGNPPMFFINADLPGDNYRFTLAHELGHAIMHRFPQGDIEDQANKFAGEFLMPANEIRAELSNITIEKLASLKQRWKVSMSALVYQAHALGCISDTRYSSLFRVLSRLGYRKSEPIEIPVEKPALLPQLIDLHKTALDYTDTQMLQVFMTDSPDFFDTSGKKFRVPLRMAENPIPFPAINKRSG